MSGMHLLRKGQIVIHHQGSQGSARRGVVMAVSVVMRRVGRSDEYVRVPRAKVRWSDLHLPDSWVDMTKLEPVHDGKIDRRGRSAR